MRAKSIAAAMALALAASVAAKDEPLRPRIYFPRQIRREFSNSTVATSDSEDKPATTSVAATAGAAASDALGPKLDTSSTATATEVSKGPPASVQVSVAVTPSLLDEQGNGGSSSIVGQPTVNGTLPETKPAETTKLDKTTEQEHSSSIVKEDTPIVIAPTGIVQTSKGLDTRIGLPLRTGVSTSLSASRSTNITGPTPSLNPNTSSDAISEKASATSLVPTASDKGVVEPPPVINGTDAQELPATTSSRTNTLGPIQSVVSDPVPGPDSTSKEALTNSLPADTTSKVALTSSLPAPDSTSKEVLPDPVLPTGSLPPVSLPLTNSVQPGLDATSKEVLTDPVLPTGSLPPVSLPLTTSVPVTSSIPPTASDKTAIEPPLVNNTSSEAAEPPPATSSKTNILGLVQSVSSDLVPGDLGNSIAVLPQTSTSATSIKETPVLSLSAGPLLPETSVSVPANKEAPTKTDATSVTSIKETPVLSLSAGPLLPETSASVPSGKEAPTKTDSIQSTPVSSPTVSQTKPVLPVEPPVSNSSSVELPSVSSRPTSATLINVPAVNTTSSEMTSTPFVPSASISSPSDIPVTNRTSAVDETAKKPATTLSPVSSVETSVVGSPTIKTSLSSSFSDAPSSKATASLTSTSVSQGSATSVTSVTASSPTESTGSTGSASTGIAGTRTASTGTVGTGSASTGTASTGTVSTVSSESQPPSTPVTEATTTAAPSTQPTATPSQDPFPTNIPKVIAVNGSDATPEGTTRVLIALNSGLTWGEAIDNSTLFAEIARTTPWILASALKLDDISSIRSLLKPCNIDKIDGKIDDKLPPREWRVVINTTVPSAAASSLKTVILPPIVRSAQLQLEDGNRKAIDPNTKLTAQFDLYADTDKCGGGSGRSSSNGDAGGAIPPSTDSGSPGRDVFNDGNNGEQTGAQKVRTGVVTATTIVVSVAFGGAMFVVARRYKRKKQPHRRSGSVAISQGSSEMRYTGGGSPALMGGSLLARDHFNYGAGGRDSRGSGRSGMGNSARTANISAPVAAENSLGWN